MSSSVALYLIFETGSTLPDLRLAILGLQGYTIASSLLCAEVQTQYLVLVQQAFCLLSCFPSLQDMF